MQSLAILGLLTRKGRSMRYHSNHPYTLATVLAISLLSGHVALGKSIYKCASGGHVTFTDHPCEQAGDVASQPAGAERVNPRDCAVDRLKTTEPNGKSSNPATGKQVHPADVQARDCGKDSK